jgi:hypothetical protein
MMMNAGIDESVFLDGFRSLPDLFQGAFDVSFHAFQVFGLRGRCARIGGAFA